MLEFAEVAGLPPVVRFAKASEQELFVRADCYRVLLCGLQTRQLIKGRLEIYALGDSML